MHGQQNIKTKKIVCTDTSAKKVIQNKWLLIIKPTRRTNFSNLYWFRTFPLSPSSGDTLRAISLASCQQNLYDIYDCCVYSEKLLVMDRGTVRNM